MVDEQTFSIVQTVDFLKFIEKLLEKVLGNMKIGIHVVALD